MCWTAFWNKGDNPLPFVLVEDVVQAIHLAISTDDVVGKCYNVIGDVRLSAKEYITELSLAFCRPLRFYSRSVENIKP